MMRTEDLIKAVIVGVIVALVMRRLAAPRPSVSTVDLWLNPLTGMYEPINQANLATTPG